MKFLDPLPMILMGSTIALVQFQAAQALTPQQISEIGKQITVIIGGPDGKGSGVIIGKEGNTYTVLTAHHVVSAPGAYAIQTIDGATYPVYNYTELYGADLAIVEFTSNRNYQVAQIGNSQQMREGSKVYYAGYPVPQPPTLPRTYQFNEGIVSSIIPNAPEGYGLKYSGIALPGMSGGPVLDDQGRLIAINGLLESRQLAVDLWTVTGTKGIPMSVYRELVGRLRENRTPQPISSPTPTPTPIRAQTPPPAPPTPTPTPSPEPTPTPAPEISSRQIEEQRPQPSPTIRNNLSTPEVISRATSSLPRIAEVIEKMTHAQQAYFVRQNSFSGNVNQLVQTYSIQLLPEYNYAMRTTLRSAYQYAIPREPNSNNLKSYVGATFLEQSANQQHPVAVFIICESTEATGIRPADPVYARGKLSCSHGTQALVVYNIPPTSDISLINTCRFYNRSAHQTQALEWLQGQIPPATWDQFITEWKSFLGIVPEIPKDLVSACGLYQPFQAVVFAWLQWELSPEIMTEFAQRWRRE